MPTESQHRSHSNNTYDDFIFVTAPDPAADCTIIAGHHWTAVIVEKLLGFSVDEGVHGDLEEEVDSDDDIPDKDIQIFVSFINQCYQTLREKVDKRSGEHPHTPWAPDDVRGDDHQGRWGMPRESWPDIGVVESCVPGDTRGRQISSYATRFLRSFPGSPSAASNRRTHDLIWAFVNGSDVTESESAETLGTLEYRLDQMDIADYYVRALGVPYPNGKHCDDFADTPYRRDHSRGVTTEEKARMERFRSLFRILMEDPDEILFPRPWGYGLQYCDKGVIFLAAALNETELSLEEIKERLRKLIAEVGQQVETSMELLEKDREVMLKHRLLLDTVDSWSL